MALHVAIPKQGRLYEPAAPVRDAVNLLHQQGHHVFSAPRRAKYIAEYAGIGELDAAVITEDLLCDAANPHVTPVAVLTGFAPTFLYWAAPPMWGLTVQDLDGCRVATSYPTVATKAAAQEGMTIRPQYVPGQSEKAVRDGIADAVVDSVKTGATLRDNGLTIVGESIMPSRLMLVRRRAALAQADEDTLACLVRILVHDGHADLVGSASVPGVRYCASTWTAPTPPALVGPNHGAKT